jgi:KDO2-lipid IV(A) lauroyltransferase
MDLLTRVRAARNVHMFPYDRAPRRILEASKRNEFTGFLLDFGVTHQLDLATVDVNFFGSKTRFPAGPAQLALITGAPILVGHSWVAPDGKIHVHGTEPILVKRTGDRQQALQVAMQEIASRFEAFIRQYPEQWYMFRPMWQSPNPRRKWRMPRLLNAYRQS